ncbi:acyl carrier protein [Klebsiella aerogenes]|uniref:acyl carrier protein n=1 Tax=Klebsiella aerogenes TaxID=548 RepID=UPI0028DED722|nr:acyl carrier protein [Klebsiella aerogenes]MDT8880999.1 acyl carrier protein [Klebsiella aerogenes]
MNKHSKFEIIELIRTNIAEETKMKKEDIDINLPISKLEMDSLAVTALCVNLEKILNMPVKPYIAWDYPTIAKMAEFLANQQSV